MKYLKDRKGGRKKDRMHMYKEKKKTVGKNKFPSILFLVLKMTFYLNYSGSQIKLHDAAGHGFIQTL